ncbi:MAG TPA: preprotein translocase subunit SecG [Candidatus Paceibacterota bacterium]|nr:preprotein translocase subunit SecG [Verrucomicrobiota bacterium]HSA12051.1 preprotein translocase subunit SecG [Candidatus Paceibacterota bacterium]
MGFLIGLLTVVMVLDCVVLILLVLIQLPKKDAGVGLAFGGGATDALFGAGSGNVLTKITKYAAGAFFILALVLSLLQRAYQTRTTSAFQEGLMKASPTSVTPPTPAQPPAAAPKPAAVPGTNTLTIAPPAENTNLPVPAPASPPTSAPPKQ